MSAKSAVSLSKSVRFDDVVFLNESDALTTANPTPSVIGPRDLFSPPAQPMEGKYDSDSSDDGTIAVHSLHGFTPIVKATPYEFPRSARLAQRDEQVVENINRLKEVMSITFFIIHAEFYALLVSTPTIIWCFLQIVSEKNMFDGSFSDWSSSDIFFYTIDTSIMNMVLCSSAAIPIILAYGRAAMRILPMFLFVFIALMVWTTIASSFLRHWVDLVTLLFPLYIFAALFVIYTSYMVHRLHLMQWYKVFVWYIPFLLNLALVDFLLHRYFRTDDTGWLTFAYRVSIRFIIVPGIYTAQIFIARVVCVSLFTLPENQRLSLSVIPTFFRCAVARVLVARGGTYSQIVIMLFISAANDILMRVTIRYRDKFAIDNIKRVYNAIRRPFGRATVAPTTTPYMGVDAPESFAKTMTALVTADSVFVLGTTVDHTATPYDMLFLGEKEGFLVACSTATEIPVLPSRGVRGPDGKPDPAIEDIYMGYGRLLCIMTVAGLNLPAEAVPSKFTELLSRAPASALKVQPELRDAMTCVRSGFWTAFDHFMMDNAGVVDNPTMRSLLCCPPPVSAAFFMDKVRPFPRGSRRMRNIISKILSGWETHDPRSLAELVHTVMGSDVDNIPNYSIEVSLDPVPKRQPVPTNKIFIDLVRSDIELTILLKQQCDVRLKPPIFGLVRHITDRLKPGPIVVQVHYWGLQLDSATDDAMRTLMAATVVGEQELFDSHTAVLTNEMIIDSATIFSVSWMVFAFNLIFKRDTLHTFWSGWIQLLVTQIAFAVLVDFVSVFAWSLPNLRRRNRSLFRVVWDDRARNFLMQIMTGNIIMTMFFTYRMFLALAGSWHT
ncbi:hypothetical protein J8273_8083 [Carpediemonas membranifera]|uniref:Transmembrane protein n=1 Tax=Carpediemonas membranifera TaxID=201153 RepID=A0A8J6APK3_9EUKA|nr:hypothetical protein J8273_8083 [Carpediemonas membranifera]|eukprot:KAG9390046.1 hypothetical protein J8273_8083 [Carpediemonas membranifera]